MKNDFSDFSGLDAMKNHPVSGQIDQLFRSVIKEEKKKEKQEKVEAVSAKDEELTLDGGEIEIDLGGDMDTPQESPLDEGLDLSFSEEESLDLGDSEYSEESSEDSGYGDISLGDEEVHESQDESPMENLGELSFDEAPAIPESDSGAELSLSEPDDSMDLGGLDLVGDEPPADNELSTVLKLDDNNLSEGLDIGLGDGDLSSDAMEKLKEIDAILEYDASQVGIKPSASLAEEDDDLDQPLVSDDLDLGSLNFGAEAEEEEVVPAPKEDKSKKKKKEPEAREAKDRDLGADLKEISGAYSGEMERLQATISNLRSDREELLAKIQKLEDDRVLQNRQSLTMRAELDEKKIELTIIRKKLNEEINELKDRMKLHDEKRLILEEKNRLLQQELDKAAQKNKIDVKKVQMRERELEQKLELLKADAETQIRNRDLKILELKRKIDAMEFDMESISQQEKRSVESRYELEDKLEKAIKTLRSAITVLEDETDRTSALNALKKNIEM